MGHADLAGDDDDEGSEPDFEKILNGDYDAPSESAKSIAPSNSLRVVASSDPTGRRQYGGLAFTDLEISQIKEENYSKEEAS